MRKISFDELTKELDKVSYRECHVHHTWKPTHKSFNGRNHIQLQKNMRSFHMDTNGWSDIGQHISIFPDGVIVTGRDFNRNPASIKGSNSRAFMFETIGNFDIKGTGVKNSLGYDELNGKQLETVLKIVRYFIDRLGESSIVFHRERSGKTCPGTSIDKKELIKQAKDLYKVEHWANEYYESLNKKGIEIHEKRFDDNVTRGELFALLDRIIK